MLKEKNRVEPPQVIINGTAIREAKKVVKVEHSIVGAESKEQLLGSDMKKDDTDKMTTIEVSYSTREKLDALKIDRESYESVIQRLIERSAARACCAARWM